MKFSRQSSVVGLIAIAGPGSGSGRAQRVVSIATTAGNVLFCHAGTPCTVDIDFVPEPEPEPDPLPPSPPPTPGEFVVTSGPCTVSETRRCVGRWPGGYLANEDCEIVVAGGGGVLGACPVFDINPYSTDSDPQPDGLTLPVPGENIYNSLSAGCTGRCQYYGNPSTPYRNATPAGDCPAGVVLAPGSSVSWHSGSRWQGNHGNGLPSNWLWSRGWWWVADLLQ